MTNEAEDMQMIVQPTGATGAPAAAARAANPAQGAHANAGAGADDNRPVAPLRRAAQELEALFLAEMMSQAGLGRVPGFLGGGAGEERFASFLVREQAREIARAGGIGLAESLFRALPGRNDAR